MEMVSISSLDDEKNDGSKHCKDTKSTSEKSINTTKGEETPGSSASQPPKKKLRQSNSPPHVSPKNANRDSTQGMNQNRRSHSNDYRNRIVGDTHSSGKKKIKMVSISSLDDEKNDGSKHCKDTKSTSEKSI